MASYARAIAALLLCVIAVCGCATAPPPLPYGGYDQSRSHLPGPPRPGLLSSETFAQAFGDAARVCQSPIVTARALVRGTIGRRRIDTSFDVGIDLATRRLRLESVESERLRFGLLASYSYGPNVINDDESTLVVTSKRWVVRSKSRELVEVLLGVPLAALDLQTLLLGCPAGTGTLRYEEFDERTMKMAIGDDAVLEVFMRRRSVASPWTVFATVAGIPGRTIRWRADPGKRSGGVLESVRLTSVEWNGTTGRLFELTFSLGQIQTPATADAFALPLPDPAEELPVDAVALNISVPLLADE